MSDLTDFDFDWYGLQLTLHLVDSENLMMTVHVFYHINVNFSIDDSSLGIDNGKYHYQKFLIYKREV